MPVHESSMNAYVHASGLTFLEFARSKQVTGCRQSSCVCMLVHKSLHLQARCNIHAV